MLSKADILFQDKYIIAVDKPAGLMVEPDPFGNPNAVDQVLKLLDHPPKKMKGGLGVVYRLDRPVSGVLIFALTPASLKSLNRQIAQRQIQKTYRAWVEGQMESNKGTWCWALERSADGKSAIEGKSKEAKEARTAWEMIEQKSNRSLLSIHLHSGRFHQIRIHASLSGHPIVNDQNYGASSSGNMNSIQLNAHSYSFHHPKTGEWMRIESRLNFD